MSHEQTISHFMFIDSDIGWEPIEIAKLLLADKDIVGGVYPLKKYNFDRLVSNPRLPEHVFNKKSGSGSGSAASVVSAAEEENLIQHHLLRYNFNAISSMAQIVDSLMEVKHAATGFMMIKRNVFNQFSEEWPQKKYKDDIGFLKTEAEQQQAYAYFGNDVVDGRYLSEDWLFCHNWRTLGGQVFVEVTINLSHIGTEEFKGSLLSTLL